MPGDYKDYMAQQKKYIETKKEALQAKQEKWSKQKDPNWGDPPPAKTPIFPFVAGAIGFFGLFLLALSSMASFGEPVVEREGLTLWIQGNADEAAQIIEWIAPEIEGNNLTWNIESSPQVDELGRALLTSPPDLILVSREVALELHNSGRLITLQDKREIPTFDSYYHPLWEEGPWRKQAGWAIPQGAQIGQARHLFTILTHFAPAFFPG